MGKADGAVGPLAKRCSTAQHYRVCCRLNNPVPLPLGAPFKAASVEWGVAYTSNAIGSEVELSTMFTTGVEIPGLVLVGQTMPALDCFAAKGPGGPPGVKAPKKCYAATNFDFQLATAIRNSNSGTR